MAAPPLLNIRQTSLPKALAELAQAADVELLFDQKLVRGLPAPPVKGRLSANAALGRLLAGSGVGYRATPDGAFVLFALPSARAADPGDGAISELLVVGRRTQNADIRRSINDVQPYWVAERRDIEAAHRDDIEQFLRSRNPSNAQRLSPGQDTFHQPASTRSAVDFRGFGSGSTLVLVDGRRMPYVPSGQGEFNQADLNGIPLGAIERIETLTSAAGGIYGPSALGGVVNVVLRRDYRGADLSVTSGLSDRGDAGHARIEGRLGFTPDQGNTDIMVFASHAVSQSFLAGQRDYQARSRQLQFANDPSGYAARAQAGAGVIVYSANGPLTLDPHWGGTALNAAYTYLPINFSGTPAQRVALLAANAGKLPLSLPDDESGARRSLVAKPTVTSGLLNIRRWLGPGLEIFADALRLSNKGQAVASSLAAIYSTDADAPGNPFGQSIAFRYPTPSSHSVATTAVDVTRLTAGFIADLPRGWKASGDYTRARTLYSQTAEDISPGLDFGFIQGTGSLGEGGRPAIDPLGDWATLMSVVPAYNQGQTLQVVLKDQSHDASLRLAGPIMRLAGGPLTATIQVQARQDHVPSATVATRFSDFNFNFDLPERAQAIRSSYVELRAPLAPMDAGAFYLRGLEVQLAVRHDRTTTTLPDDGSPGLPSNDALIAVRRNSTVYTAGARLFPISAIMLRASVATGELPLTLTDLQTTSNISSGDSSSPLDPRRGNQRLGAQTPYTTFLAGSHTVAQARARTLALGAVINPTGAAGPRVSIDYSHTEKTREVEFFRLTAAQLLDAEAAYPGRVLRAALTPADIAAGFSVGAVTALDLGAINSGRIVADAVDMQFDWRIPTDALGDLRFYGVATWQPAFKHRLSPSSRAINKVGYVDGPLEWRGNVGVEWIGQTLTLDLNAQYYDAYDITQSDPSDTSNTKLVQLQGGARIPAQVYVDLSGRRSFALGERTGGLSILDVRLGVQNIFDARPPTIALYDSPGYSFDGDPRRRRLELTLSSKF